MGFDESQWEEHKKFIKKQAAMYHGRLKGTGLWFEHEELVSMLKVKFVECLPKYDRERGASLKTYLQTCFYHVYIDLKRKLHVKKCAEDLAYRDSVRGPERGPEKQVQGVFLAWFHQIVVAIYAAKAATIKRVRLGAPVYRKYCSWEDGARCISLRNYLNIVR